MWKDFPARLVRKTGYGALLYSRAGYGKSAPCQLPRPLSFMHAEGLSVLPKLLDAAKVQEAVLVGHSDGASIALIHAGGSGDRRVKGLVLMAPHVFVEEVTLASIRAARQAYEMTDLRERLARYHGRTVDCAFLGWNQAWLDPGFLDWNLEAFLPGIQVPVLLLQGEDDQYGTSRQLAAIARQVPQEVECLLLPDCGHAPFRDQLETVLQAVTRFVLFEGRGADV
jgi:pimeloyl-ACP methyl ester carboxylesterase